MKAENLKVKNVISRKRQKRRAPIAFSLVAIFCVFFFGGGETLFAQDFQAVADGVEHARMTRRMKSADGKDENVVFNFLRLDLTKVRLDVVHALDAAIGLEKTSSIAIRYGAFAAINAGFFRLDKSIFAGDAAGVLVIDGKLLSESFNGRIALGLSNRRNKTEVWFTKQNTIPALKIGNRDWEISGINRERKTDELILFTPEFHRTTLTDNDGLEIFVEGGKVFWIADGKGSGFIPGNGFVLSANGKAREKLLAQVKIGEKLAVGARHFPFKSVGGEAEDDNNAKLFMAQDIEDFVGGVPQLIRNGKIDITWQQEKTSKAFVETHHPRTAAALLKDGKFLMITVDGRSEESGGISLPDLANVLLEMGATDAMNLDGGGSTTMFLNGKVVNKPSNKEGERAVSDAILVFPRKKN
jgi:exopolysaccharide biosynthesis protein